MLVLSRGEDQSIIILHKGEVIKVMITSVASRNKVRLGITAPEDADIWREEIYYKIIDAAKKRNSQ